MFVFLGGHLSTWLFYDCVIMMPVGSGGGALKTKLFTPTISLRCQYTMTAVTTNGATAVVGDNVDEQDPYRALEELEGEAAQEFVRFSNQMCLVGLGDPTQSETYPRILKALQADDRLPLVSQLGVNTTTGEPELYNLWKDKKVGGGCCVKSCSVFVHSSRMTNCFTIRAVQFILSTHWIYVRECVC